MAYTKTPWTDRAVANPRTFTKSGETSTEVTLTQLPGTITQAGTPVNATALNNMEDGIAQAHWYAVTTNLVNVYSATLSPAPASLAVLVGVPIRLKINANASGAVTININLLGAKSVKSSQGAAITNWKLNAIVTVVYNGTDFIIQGEGSDGTALAPDLLIGKTATVLNGDIVGTMPDRAGDTVALSSAVSGTTLRLRASDGYRDGTNDFVTITDADWIAANIPLSINMFGIVGTGSNAKRSATGSATTNATGDVTVGGLSFTPRLISVSVDANPGNYHGGGSTRGGFTKMFNGTVSATTASLSAGVFGINIQLANSAVTWEAVE
jgi:hypothetical protein